MKLFFESFAESAKEFRNLRSLVTAALLVALHTVMALFLSISVTESLRISISFVVNVVIGCLFGPVMGFVCGGVGDILQYLFKPTAPYFFGWTISSALAGMIYGIFFYRRMPKNFVEFIKKSKDENTVKESIVGRIVLYVLPTITFLLVFTVPFLTVTDKKTGELITSGTAIHTLMQGISGINCKNAAIVAGIILVMSVVLVVLNIFRLQTIPLMISVLLGATAVLSVYTDKKTTNAQWGFWLIMAVVVCYIVIQIILLAKKHKVDLPFMIICIVALTLDTVFVNIFLGTKWVNMMYGKGYWFYFTTRLIKNLIQLPINIIITYYVLGFMRNIKHHIKN